MDKLEAKVHKLKRILAGMKGVLIAYSGGADSTFLLKMALDTLGERVVAVTEKAPIFPSSEIKAAQEIAHQLGVKHLLLEAEVLGDPYFSSNPPERCYICKRMLFSRLKELAEEYGFEVADGSNYDDLGEYRPGLRALRELGVRSPLVEAGLTKEEIRFLSKEMGLPTWDKPAQACLATRFPYGEQLTPEKLERVEKAESFLHSLGFHQLRVRSHDVLARIEVSKGEMARLLELATLVIAKFEELGYTYITLDLEGYRSGSMDEILV
ncbi:MAG TPA: ATP-dependent sacrificial sulfur transferase LarE [Chloroflexi bacterium]|nr:ATP-dependent sacrificial sulfur transferase LarE [Chloroflexota bacterium]